MQIVNGNYDTAARESFKGNPATAISFWLSASYAYYCRYESLLSDEVFDKMSKYILEKYDEIEHHHKHLVTEDGLKAGSGYYLKENDYPLIVRVSTEKLMEDLNMWRSSNQCIVLTATE